MIRIENKEVAFRELLAKVGSLSLVQVASGEIRKKLAATERRLVEVSEKLEAAVAAYADYPSTSGGDDSSIAGAAELFAG